MPPIGACGTICRVGRKLGGGILNTAIGVSLFAAIGQIIGPKENIENYNLNNDDIKGFKMERNSNLVEVKMGAGATVMAIIGVILLLGICAIGAKGLTRCFKRSKVMKYANKNKKKENDEPEDNTYEMEDI